MKCDSSVSFISCLLIYSYTYFNPMTPHISCLCKHHCLLEYCSSTCACNHILEELKTYHLLFLINTLKPFKTHTICRMVPCSLNYEQILCTQLADTPKRNMEELSFRQCFLIRVSFE